MNAFYNPQTKYKRAVLESHCWSVNYWFDRKVCYKFVGSTSKCLLLSVDVQDTLYYTYIFVVINTSHM